MDNGLLIAIEGIDGSGLSTQSERLKDYLERGLGYSKSDRIQSEEHKEFLSIEQYPDSPEESSDENDEEEKQSWPFGPVTYLTKEPTDGPIGGEIKEVLTGRLEVDAETLALMFAADRRDHTEKTIRPLIEQGKTVIADRYILSTLAYQGLEVDDLDWLLEINSKSYKPDLVIMIDLPASVAKQRIEENRIKTEIYETEEKLAEVREMFKTGSRKLMQEGYDVRIVDGDYSKDNVEKQIISHVEDKLSDTLQSSLHDWHH